jgi:lysozyme family protein
MSDFLKAWPVLKVHEGTRYSQYGWDPGGATKYGITLRTARALNCIDFDLDDDGDVDSKDIELLTEHDAILFYRLWWDRYEYGKITDQQVATKIMDMSINMGPRGYSKNTNEVYGAHALVQKALNALGHNVVVDGFLGPKSISEINSCTPRDLVVELCVLQMDHYRKWCDQKADREVARKGLYHRAYWPYVEDGYVPTGTPA